MPPPELGSLWSAELGGEQIVRAPDHAYLSDPAIDPLIASGRVIAPLDADRMREALLLTLTAPPLDLLSGGWKPKRSWALDPSLVRLAKRLAIALLVPPSVPIAGRAVVACARLVASSPSPVKP